MKEFLIILAIVLVLMFICSGVYKLIQDAHSRAENSIRRHTEKPTTEDLKDRFK